MTRWLVTGATGLLGSNFARVASSRPGIELWAMSRSQDRPPGYDAFATVDISHEEAVRAVIERVKPDVILHAAALASHEECEKDPEFALLVNATATGVLSKCAQQSGAHFIYISTDAVFDGAQGYYKEEDVPSPFSVYGSTKLSGEYFALSNENSLVVRTNFFGWSPSGSRSILEFFVNNLRRSIEIPGFTDFVVSSIYVCDLAHTLLDLADLNARGIFHVASHDSESKYKFGQMVCDEFGFSPELIIPRLASTMPGTTDRGRNLSLDVNKAESLLARPMQTQRRGIAQSRSDESDFRTLRDSG